MQTVNCPNCRASLPHLPAYVGISVLCPSCNAAFVMPAPRRNGEVVIPCQLCRQGTLRPLTVSRYGDALVVIGATMIVITTLIGLGSLALMQLWIVLLMLLLSIPGWLLVRHQKVRRCETCGATTPIT